jgi:hypothetical protein
VIFTTDLELPEAPASKACRCTPGRRNEADMRGRGEGVRRATAKRVETIAYVGE